jgi:hypothetical protein
LELSGAAHRRAPDLYINLKGDDDLNAYGVPGTTFCDAGGYGGTPLGGGSHGGLHATELAAVLIGDGPGLKTGGQIVASRTGIYDIAPTILDLLGVEPPATMTGRPMHELLETAEFVPAPVVTEFTARTAGKVSRILIGHVGSHPYVDEADVLIEGQADVAPVRREHLKVPELQSS